MAHTAHTWANGDTLTATLLNALEIDLAALGNPYTDEQAQDAIAAAFANGTMSGITVVYDDANNRFNMTVTPGSTADATASTKGAIQLTGDLTGTAASPQLAQVITAGTIGSATSIPSIQYDAKGRIVAVTANTLNAAVNFAARTVTAATTVTGSGDFVIADATSSAYTVTGPAAGTARRWGVKKSDTGTNVVTISYVDQTGATTTINLSVPQDAKTFEPLGLGYVAVGSDNSRTQSDLRYLNVLGTPSNPVTSASAARPSGLTVVYWLTPTQPTNWATNDVWTDNS